MKVIIVDEGTTVIKYRDFTDQAGPVYSVRKDQVESVKYRKGGTHQQVTDNTEKPAVTDSEIQQQLPKSKELTVKNRFVIQDGKVISPRTVKSLMEDFPEVEGRYDKGRKLCSISNTCLGLSILNSYIGSTIINKKKTQSEKLKTGIPILSASVGLMGAAAVLAIYGKKNIRKSVTMYNAAVNKQVTYYFDFGFQEDGVGLGMRF